MSDDSPQTVGEILASGLPEGRRRPAREFDDLPKSQTERHHDRVEFYLDQVADRIGIAADNLGEIKEAQKVTALHQAKAASDIKTILWIVVIIGALGLFWR